tara:strand:- start:1666 stop:2127 length:462 start_codon:yes stop_codon:yes gene_type:complete
LPKKCKFLIAILFFALSGFSSVAEENRFAVAGIGDPQQVQIFFERIQRDVRVGDRKNLAEIINYPLNFFDDKGRHVKVRSARDFKLNYEKIFTKTVREVILRQKYSDLFVNYQGVMIGRGVIWFGKVGRSGNVNDKTYVMRIYTVNSNPTYVK